MPMPMTKRDRQAGEFEAGWVFRQAWFWHSAGAWDDGSNVRTTFPAIAILHVEEKQNEHGVFFWHDFCLVRGWEIDMI